MQTFNNMTEDYLKKYFNPQLQNCANVFAYGRITMQMVEILFECFSD
jgi:hypothetical protein